MLLTEYYVFSCEVILALCTENQPNQYQKVFQRFFLTVWQSLNHISKPELFQYERLTSVSMSVCTLVSRL